MNQTPVEIKEYFKGFATGAICLASLASVCLYTYRAFFGTTSGTDAQEGYVNLENFSTRTEDLDSDGKDEVVANYNGREYLFMKDENGMPILKGYQIVNKLKDGKLTSKLEILTNRK